MKHEEFYKLCDQVHQGTRQEAEDALEKLTQGGAKVTGSSDSTDVVVAWQGVAKHVQMPVKYPDELPAPAKRKK